MTLLPLILCLLSASVQRPLLGIYLEALSLWSDGDREGASALFGQIAERMPHQPRALYNLAALAGESGLWGRADTLMTALSGWDGLSGDSLYNACVSASLGAAMEAEDYQGVLEQLNATLPRVASATADSLTRHNYEVALRWLSEREPPPEQDQQQDEQQDEQQDQQDEQQDQQDEQQDEQQDQQDEQQDQQDEQQDQQDEQQDETRQPQPPEQGEMTPEEAQRILDMVEEAEPRGDKDASGTGVPGAPNW